MIILRKMSLPQKIIAENVASLKKKYLNLQPKTRKNLG